MFALVLLYTFLSSSSTDCIVSCWLYLLSQTNCGIDTCKQKEMSPSYEPMLLKMFLVTIDGCFFIWALLALWIYKGYNLLKHILFYLTTKTN